MNRCLHITIQENTIQENRIQKNPTAAPGRSSAGRAGRSGTDPGADFVMPPIDDPGSDFVMPPIDDPGADFVMPPIDDPSTTGYGGPGYSAGAACGATVQASCCGCHCGCGAPTGTAPGNSTGASTPHPFIKPRDFTGFVIVRTAQGIDPNAASLWELANRKGRQLLGLQAVLELPFKT
jgi:hypothetical protein